MCKKAKKYGRVNRKGGVGPPDGVVGVGHGGLSGFEVGGGGDTTQDDNTNRDRRGASSRVTGLNLIYRADKSACYRGVTGCALLLSSSACLPRQSTRTAGGGAYRSRSVASEV